MEEAEFEFAEGLEYVGHCGRCAPHGPKVVREARYPQAIKSAYWCISTLSHPHAGWHTHEMRLILSTDRLYLRLI